MATLNISLPVRLKRFVEEEVQRGHYGSASELFRELLRELFRRHEEESLERKLLEGLASESKKMSDADWSRLRATVRKRKKSRR